jgi:hypothetical protein
MNSVTSYPSSKLGSPSKSRKGSIATKKMNTATIEPQSLQQVYEVWECPLRRPQVAAGTFDDAVAHATGDDAKAQRLIRPLANASVPSSSPRLSYSWN